MKYNNTITATMIIGLCLSAQAMASSFELRVGGAHYRPNGAAATGASESGLVSVDWDKGNGFDGQAIVWQSSSPWGFGVSVGTAAWDIDDYYEIVGIELNALSGDADLLSFGISVLRRLSTDKEEGSKFSADIELGLRYVSIESNISGVYGVATQDGDYYARQTIELDDGFVALIALTGKYELDPQWCLFAQMGYQFDLNKADAISELPGIGVYDAGETELNAIYGKVGVAFSFE